MLRCEGGQRLSQSTSLHSCHGRIRILVHIINRHREYISVDRKFVIKTCDHISYVEEENRDKCLIFTVTIYKCYPDLPRGARDTNACSRAALFSCLPAPSFILEVGPFEEKKPFCVQQTESFLLIILRPYKLIRISCE